MLMDYGYQCDDHDHDRAKARRAKPKAPFSCFLRLGSDVADWLASVDFLSRSDESLIDSLE